MAYALRNGRVLTDEGFLEHRAVLIDGADIVAVCPEEDQRLAAATSVDLAGRLLLPGFIDTQVNGGGGVQFNEDPCVGSIRAIGRAHRRCGTTGFLPTLISDDPVVMARAIAAVEAALAAGVPGVLGIHIEGPFLNEARKGVHDPAKFRDLDAAALRLLTSMRAGKTLVTLAPEVTAPGAIPRLVQAGVLVSAGHSNASHAEIRRALGEGLRGFTHLFNAMSQMTGREPGVVGAALEDPDSWCGIIVDGRHVDPVVLRIALRAKAPERFMLVTDAMACVGTEQRSFMLQGRRIEVQDGVCIDEDGVLAGSALDMAHAVRNAITLLGLELPAAVRMASRNPAEFLGLDASLGRIAPGYRANFVVADDELRAEDTWIDGRSLRLHGEGDGG
ncbi:MAG TPA: N-acetylglucosamine-6-phosphate deacetylase [Steroidobacteraceae bacterium]|nr:N-acetylglucosamine-6-phosphate deacetylase [Steroidobacteraceae bacterium]